MTRFAWAISLAILLGTAISTPAHHGMAYRSRTSAAYYYAVPVAVVAVPVPAVCVPLPYENLLPLFAQPRPAPASAGTEPPLADPSKEASPRQPPAPQPPDKRDAHSSSYFDSYAVAPGATAQPEIGRCSVSFWNLAPRDLIVQVGGRRVTLAGGRSLTLELTRQFT